MALGLATSVLHAVTGPSSRLREEVLSGLLDAWQGPRRSLGEDDNLDAILVDLETPGIFAESTLSVLRVGERWAKDKVERLRPLAGRPPSGSHLVIVAQALEAGGRSQPLTKALAAAGALHEARPPWQGLKPSDASRAAEQWVLERLKTHPAGLRDASTCAARLVEAYGEDADALLNVIEVVGLYADEAPIDLAAVEGLCAGVAERPVYDFTGAVLEGRVQRAIELLHAGQGMEGPQALAALHNELRRMLACQESEDDSQVQAWLGSKGSLYYVRRRARVLDRQACLRLLGDLILAQRRCRQGAADPLLLTELTVLHAQRVLRAPGRGVGDGASRHGPTMRVPQR